MSRAGQKYAANTPVWVKYDQIEYAGITRIYGDGEEHDTSEVLVFFPETNEEVWMSEDCEDMRKRTGTKRPRSTATPRVPKETKVSSLFSAWKAPFPYALYCNCRGRQAQNAAEARVPRQVTKSFGFSNM